MGRLRNMKLASKLAAIISAMLVVIFTALILVTVFLTQGTISTTISAELGQMANVNGQKVQEVFNVASTMTNNMINYLEKEYKNAQAIAEEGKNNQFTSKVFNVPLKQVPYEMENYLTSLALDTAENSADIFGVGALFEPNLFAANIPEYSFYVDEKTKQVKPYGSYSEYSKEEFYQDAATEKIMKVSKPIDYQGTMMVSVSAPILYNGQLMGVTVSDVDINKFADKIEINTDRYSSMYAYVMDDMGRIVYDSRTTDNVGKNLSEIAGNDNMTAIQEKIDAGNGKQAFSVSIHRPDGGLVSGFFSPVSAGGENWWSVTALNTSEMNASVVTTTLWMIGIVVAAFIILVGVVILVLRKMLNPIKKVVQAAEDISQGHFDIHLEAKSGDEIGMLTRTFDHTAATLKRVIEDISRVLNSIANKNLDVEASTEYVGELGQIRTSMENIIGNMNTVMGGISQAADQVSGGSDQVSSGAQALSQGATEQASSIEELAATINEISGQITTSASSAAQASEKANIVGGEAAESNQRMQGMLQAMDEINNSSKEIGKIIKTIEDIAFQTNILALNAAVEAARAGVAGKGFAVVADEVRNLASKSAEASKNTAALIEASIQSVEHGTKIADETAQSLLTVVDGVKDVAATIDRISEASNEQAQSVVQVTQGVDQISSVVQTNSATAEESAAASEELSSQAQLLKSLVGQFKLKMGMEDSTFPGPEMGSPFQEEADFYEDTSFSGGHDKY